MRHFSTGALALGHGRGAARSLGRNANAVSLFKVITAKDEVIIGLNTRELRALGGPEKAPAGIIASALASKKELTVWQYAVRKSDSGELQVAPVHPIGLLAHDSLRVEPYPSKLTILPHD